MSKTEKTDDLINSLCGDLEPQKVSSPYRHIFVWALLSIIYIIGIVLYLELAVDLEPCFLYF